MAIKDEYTFEFLNLANEYSEIELEQALIQNISKSNLLFQYQILEYKKECKDTTALEQEIDNMVYKLNELTYNEVKIIDP